MINKKLLTSIFLSILFTFNVFAAGQAIADHLKQKHI